VVVALNENGILGRVEAAIPAFRNDRRLQDENGEFICVCYLSTNAKGYIAVDRIAMI